MREDSTVAFEEFVRGRSTSLFRVAVLLSSGDRAQAEDLLQTTLERLYRHRGTVFREGTPNAYARRIMVNASMDWRRRHRRRPERPLEIDGVESSVGDRSGQIDDRDLLLRGLRLLPPRQRAVLVLRYLEDLADADVAIALSCSVGTVKSQAARGLDKMRRYLLLAREVPSATRRERTDD